MAWLGILFALGAFLTWGFGDFFIQRSARAVGDWQTLFYIGLFGMIILFPFAYGQLNVLALPKNFALLTVLSIVTLFAALFNFEALKQGKIAVVEPIWGFEVPLTAILSYTLWQEKLTGWEIILIAASFLGIILTATKGQLNLRYPHRNLEKGVIYAGLGMVGMSLMNFLTGVSAQLTSPVLTMWVMNVYLTAFCLIYLSARGELKRLPGDFRRAYRVIFAESTLDNLAWLFFAASMTLIPIAVATAISESYIILASYMGLKFNREKMRLHQKIGAAIAIAGIICLAFYVG